MMEFSSDFATWVISGALSVGCAWGVIKTQLRNTMTYDKHREICASEREITNKHLDALYQSQKEAHGLIKEIHGYLKAKNGGSL